jgi:isopenicillin N synthase-like dioxygenase
MKKDLLVGGYGGYGSAKTEDGGAGSMDERFAIAPAWGANCFPQQNDTHNPAFDSELFETTCKEYFHAIQELGRYVFEMIADDLGIDQNFFEPFLDKQNSFCRLMHYHQAEDEVDDINDNDLAPAQEEAEVAMAPHADRGALTLLIQDTIGGLQLFDKEKEEWRDVSRLWSLLQTLTGAIGSPFAAWYGCRLHR